MSGFLYLAIVVGWAFYLVPFALRRYDEAARNRSVDRFSSAMRVLGRTGDGAVVTDEVASPHGATPSSDLTVTEEPTAGAAPRPRCSPQARREAARTAARRRRRVLLLLLLAAGGTTTAAYLVYVPWWSVAIPGALVLAWLVSCRVQARREYSARAAVRHAEPRNAVREEKVAGHEARADAQGQVGTGVEVREDAVVGAEPAAPETGQPSVPVVPQQPTAGTGSLWDPVPVTLPTYVSKPRAPRTIRTIDLGAGGVQSSVRDDQGPADRDGKGGTDGKGEQQATAARAVGQ